MASNPPVSALDKIKTADFSKDLKLASNRHVGIQTSFNPNDVARYTSYGSAIYGKLGYDPRRDNNKFYNTNTPGSADLERGFTGMLELAKVGLADTFAGGSFAAEDAHKDFEEVMNRYSSTRGGTTQFISNTMLSSGYTIGIMAAIAAEETLLALGTAATGGLGAPAAVAEGGALLTRAGRLLDRVGDSANVFKKLSTIKDARALNWIGKQGNSITKGLLPAGETMDFLRNYDKLNDLNSWGRALTGAGAIARDARKIYMTTSESKLEANMAKDEVRNQLIEDWEKNNRGRSITDEELARIDKTANDVFADVYNQNLGLIYVTNAITFDAMFKSMRHTNKLFKMADGLRMSVSKNAGKVAIDAVDDGAVSWLKRKGSELTLGKALKWTATSSMEGVQEVGQDAISEASKTYNIAGYNNQFQGSYYAELAKALKNINPETFFSGMLMGTFASPVGAAIKGFNSFTRGGGYRAITDSENYQAEKDYAREQTRRDAKILTEFFNQTGTFLDEQGRPQAAITDLQDKMLEAAEKGDRKFFEDKRSDVFRLGMETMFKNGMEQELIKHLEEMQGYTAEELNQAMNRTDITEDNKSEYLNKISNYAKRIKDYKALYDEIQETEINPVNLKAAAQQYGPNSSEYQNLKYRHAAFEARKKELLFSKEKLAEYDGRMKDLSQTLTSEKGLTQSDVTMLVTPAMLDSEIKRLSVEVANNKEYGTVNPMAEKKLEALMAYKNALSKYDSIKDESDNDDVQAEMREAFNTFMNASLDRSNSIPNAIENGNKFDLLWDYLNMGDERKVLQDHVNTMLDPNASGQMLNRWEETFKKIDQNKEQMIFDSLNAFQEKTHSNKLMEELLDRDIVFDMREIDDLIKRGIMPDKFYDVKTHEELTGDRLKEAYAIVANRYKKLTGKKILSSKKAYQSRQKYEGDKRTTTGIIREFANSKSDTPVSVKTFINRLLKSKHISTREIEILNKLKESNLSDFKIMLTTTSDSPIELRDENTIVIDVRHSGSDYKSGTVPFENLATSALLQAHLTNKINSGTLAVTDDLKAMMTTAKEAYAQQNNLGAKAMEQLDIFSDPALFMSEALNNVTFQSFLAEVEDPNSPTNESTWSVFREMTEQILDQDFNGTLLNNALDLAMLSVEQEASEVPTEILKEPVPVPAAQEEKVAEEDSTLKQQLLKLKTEKLNAEKELNRTPKYKVRARMRLTKQINKLFFSIKDLESEIALAAEKAEGSMQTEHAVNTDAPVTPVTTDELVPVINEQTEFQSLPEELQHILAKLYYNYRIDTEPAFRNELKKVVQNSITGIKTKELDLNREFEKLITSIQPEDILANLDESDYRKIEGLMKNHLGFMEAIAQFNRQNKNEVSTTQAPVIEQNQEEVVEEDTGVVEIQEPLVEAETFVDQDLEDLLGSDIWNSFSDEQKQEILDKWNSGEFTEIDIRNLHKKNQQKVARKSRKNKIETYVENLELPENEAQTRIDNWKINVARLESGSILNSSGKKVKIETVDIPYLKELFFSELTRSTDDVITMIADHLTSVKKLASNYKQTLPYFSQDNQALDIQSYIETLRRDKYLLPSLVKSLNRELGKAGYKYVVKTQGRGPSTVAKSFGVTSRQVKIKAQGETLDQKLGSFYSLDNDSTLATQEDILAYQIYRYLETNPVHPDVFDSRELKYKAKNLVDQNSQIKTLKGLIDEVFQDNEFDYIDYSIKERAADLIVGMNSLTEMRKFFKSDMEQRIKDFNDGVVAQEKYESEQSSENDYPDGSDMEEYFNSNFYLISNGQFYGDPESLSPAERKLYDQYQKGDRVLTLAGMTREQYSDKFAESLKEDMTKNTSYEMLKAVMNKVKTTNFLFDLTSALVFEESVFDLSDKQRTILKQVVLENLRDKDYSGEIVNLNNRVVKIVATDKLGFVTVQYHDTSEIVEKPALEVLKDIIQVFESGDQFNFENINTELKPEDSSVIQYGFDDFFNNFTIAISEADKLSDVDLSLQIKDQLNKCK